MYWLEYRDETKTVGPHPDPIFCGYWSDKELMRAFLPKWARPHNEINFYGSICWFGMYGDGWYLYLVPKDTILPEGTDVDVPCGNLVALPEGESLGNAETEHARVVAEQQALMIAQFAALEEDHPYLPISF